MSRFLEHIKDYGRELNNKFERSRKTLTDSGVKGGRNELIVADFFKEHIAASFIATGVQIIDSFDSISGEMDVVVCNSHQPFKESFEGFLISEGVDFCVQVKAIIDSKEISRSFENCASLKELERKFGQGDSTVEPVGVSQDNLCRIPYLIIAFSTNLIADTLHNKLIEESRKYKLFQQPDALFVIDKGLSFINFRDGNNRGWTQNGKPIKDWLQMHSAEQTLVEVLRFVHTQVPRFQRLLSPLIHYFPLSPGYQMRGKSN